MKEMDGERRGERIEAQAPDGFARKMKVGTEALTEAFNVAFSEVEIILLHRSKASLVTRP